MQRFLISKRAYCNYLSNVYICKTLFCGAGAVKRLFKHVLTCGFIGLLSLLAPAQNTSGKQWIGTWAAAPQPPSPGHSQTFRNQTLRLIVHTSAGGTKVRIKISNTFGDHPLLIGGAHIARRTDGWRSIPPPTGL